MPLEQEIKIIGTDFDVLRKALQDAGADFQARYFERNAVLDDAQRSLKERGMLLRLRQAKECVLTLKIPLAGSNEIKEMDERETRVEDFDVTLSIFQGLGLRPAFWYEKIREKWRMDTVVIDLDELPFGRYVEIEGPVEGIRDTVRRLGLEGLETTSDNYHQLNLRHRREHGLPEKEDFVFEPGEAGRILEKRSIS